MLESTFVHIPGVGATTEMSLWSQGCLHWKDLLAGLDRFSYGTALRDDLHQWLTSSVGALERRDHGFFRSALGGREAWRAFPEFRSSCVYLDIETDGGRSATSVTTIGLYDGANYTCLVKGRDLDDFPEIMARYGMVITFFGGGFDIPMLQNRFPQCRFDQIHLDLCPTLRRLGHRGGLKRIEKAMGIGRSEDTDGLDGLDAIRLWNRYRVLRDEKALETLIAYNREDVVNLEKLAEYAYGRLKRLTMGPSAPSEAATPA